MKETAKVLTSRRHDGVLCELRDSSGAPIAKEDEIEDFRGELHPIVGGRAPQRSNSTGRVWVRRVVLEGERWVERTYEYFPSVFDLRWVPAEGQEHN